MAFTEDFSPFFDLDGFAVEAKYTPTGKEQKIIKVIFDQEYVEAITDGMVPVGIQQATCLCKGVDVADAAEGEPVVINSTNYKIVGPPQPDGTGLVRLMLENQD
jgi:hypothetical protein